METKRIELQLDNGWKLVAEGPLDPNFPRELAVGLVNGNGNWAQDLVIVRQDYEYDSSQQPEYKDSFEVLVYGNSEEEDWTEAFHISKWNGEAD